MPSPGYEVRLVRAEPQGLNVRILILNKMVTPPTDLQPQVITPALVDYFEETDGPFDHVQIQPEGTLIDVMVVD